MTQTRRGNPSPSFTLTYNPEHTYSFPHTHLLYGHSFCPLCRDLECTQIHTQQTHIRSFAHTHIPPCTLMKRMGIETMVHDKQSCNCFWETALVGGCHRLVFAEDNLFTQCVGGGPGGSGHYWTDCGITWLTQYGLMFHCGGEGMLSYLAEVLLLPECIQ